MARLEPIRAMRRTSAVDPLPPYFPLVSRHSCQPKQTDHIECLTSDGMSQLHDHLFPDTRELAL